MEPSTSYSVSVEESHLLNDGKEPDEFGQKIRVRADEREDIQKKTFTKWINSQLSKADRPLVTDLFTDLTDGCNLLSLLEVLSGETLKREKGRLRVHHINNVNRALYVLENNYNVKLVNISSNDIVDGNCKLILGLVWSIILHWQMKDVMKDIMGDLQQTNLERMLLDWCRKITQGYSKIDLKNFTTCWKDGLAFNALIHKHRPELFSYEDLLDNDNYYNLDHAFKVALHHLGIEPLLDPEDVNVDNPDKKCIMMYIMCLFQALPHSNSKQQQHIDTKHSSTSTLTTTTTKAVTTTDSSTSSITVVEDLHQSGVGTTEKTQNDVTDTCTAESLMSLSSGTSSTSSRHSIMSTSSLDLISYQDMLENVLAWLLEAEDVIAKQEPVVDITNTSAVGPDPPGVMKVKQQFNEHEEFMLDLTKHQDSVGNVLKEGTDLINDKKVNEEEEHEIRVQMALLNNRWEDLRLKALSRQTKLQKVLMEFQQQQLKELDKWLTEMEETRLKQEPIGQDLETIKNQVDEHKKLQSSVEQQQKLVDSLHNMVVVVDDTNSESACEDLEQQLESLSKRWTDICSWTEDRWLLLQDILLKWQYYSEELEVFCNWLSNQEQQLVKMKAADLQDPPQVVEQVKNLKLIEKEMEFQVQRFDELYECGQQIVQYVDDKEAIQRISGQLEDVQERWETLVQNMGIQSKEIAGSGIELSKISDLEGILETEKVAEENSAKVQSSGIAKRRKTDTAMRLEFEIDMKKMKDWFERTESTLALLSADDDDGDGDADADEVSSANESNEKFSEEEQFVLIQDTKDDVKTRDAEVSSLLTTGMNLIEELKLGGENYDNVTKLTNELEGRWKNLNTLLSETHSHVLLEVEAKKFYDELEALKEIMTSYDKWATTAENINDEAVEISKQLEQCRVKLKAMKSHDARVDLLKSKVEDLNEKKMKRQKKVEKVQFDLNAFNERWNSIYQKIGEREELLAKALEETPPRAYLDALGALLKWISDMEDILNTEKINLDGMESLEKQFQQYKELQNDLQEHVGSLEYVNKTGQDLIKKTRTDDKVKTLESDLFNLNCRWSEVYSAIDDRMETVERALGQLRQLQNQITGMNRWMKEMDVFLHADDPATGDLPTLAAQMNESNGVLEDILTLQDNVDSINELSTQLSEQSDTSFIGDVKKQVEELNEKWEKVVCLAQEQNTRLAKSIQYSKEIFNKLEALTMWTEQHKRQLSNKDYAVDSFTDLSVKNKKFKSLKEDVIEQEVEINKLNTEANALLNKAQSLQELGRALMKLNSLWRDVYQRVMYYSGVYEQAETNWNLFKSLIDSEKKFQEALKKKVHHETNSSDAEEISEELEELESLMRDHPTDSKERIQQLSQDLINNSIMVNSVKNELEQLKKMDDSLEHKAQSRVTLLEHSAHQAQEAERKMLESSQWMTDVSKHLQSWLDADVLAEDIPQEYESLKEEFRQQSELFNELEKSAIVHEEQGRIEASSRLMQQTEMLKHHFDDVSLKFQRFQRPGDFEPKISHVKRELASIEEQIHLLELHSEEPEIIQGQLDTCIKFYKIMSELKSEVEYVIKTGRQVVDKKQVDFPDKLNKILDALKQQYNHLGGMVTHGKGDLEKAMKLAKKLKKETSSLEEFITINKNELEEREKSEKYNLDEETKFITTTKDEMLKRQAVVSSIRELTKQLKDMADEDMLEEAVLKVDKLNQNWNELSKKLALRQELLEAENTQLDTKFIEFQMSLMKVKEWLTKADGAISSHEHLPMIQRVSDYEKEKMKNLQMELNQLRCEVDDVRDSAISLMTKSDRYNKMVEPELSHLNQRWEEITEKLKEKQALHHQYDHVEVSIAPVLNTATFTKDSVSAYKSQEPFEERCERAKSLLDVFESNVVNQGHLCIEDFAERSETKIKEIDEELTKLQPEIVSVLLKGDNIVLEIDDKERVNKIKQLTDNLRTQWNRLKSNAEARKRKLSSHVPLWFQFRHRVEEFHIALAGLELVLKDRTQKEAVEEELKRRQRDVDSLNKIGGELKDKEVLELVEPELLKLNKRWHDIQSQSLLYHPPIDSPAVIAATSISSESLISRTTASVVSSGVSKSAAGGKNPSHYIDETKGVLSDILKVQQLLHSQELTGRDFEDFSKQEDKLKSVKESLDSVGQSVKEVLTLKEDYIQQSEEDDAKNMATMTDHLQAQWQNLKDAYSKRYKRWSKAVEQWRQFHCDLKDIMSWLNEAEKKLATAKQLPTTDGPTYEELEIGIRSHQGTVNSMNAAGNEIIRQSAAPDSHLLREKLDALNHRWKSLCGDVLERPDKFDDESVKTSEFTDDMDELFLLVDETENLLSIPLEQGEEKLEESLEKFKEREDEISTLRQRLKALNRNAHQMMVQETLSNEDKENMSKDLDNLNSRWKKLETDVPERIKYIEDKLSSLRHFLDELDEFQQWLCTTKSVLETQQGPISSVQSTNEHDSLILDAETMQKALSARQPNIDSINQKYGQMVKENHKQNTSMTDTIQGRIVRLNNDWELIQIMTSGMKPASDSTMEVLKKVKVAHELQQQGQLQSPPISTHWSNYDKSVADLLGWLSVQDHLQKANKASVGNISDIEQLIVKQKNILQNMENRQQELEDILKNADLLQQNANSDEDKKNIKEKADEVIQQWNTTKANISSRKNQLEDMLLECRQFDESYSAFNRWLQQIEEEIKSKSHNSQDLTQSLSNHKILQDEVDQRKSSAENVKQLAGKLIDEYKEEDTQYIRDLLAKLIKRWSSLTTKLTKKWQTLQANRNSLHQIHQAIDNYLGWMASVENSFCRLADETSKEDVLDNEDLCQEYLEQFRMIMDKHNNY